MQTFLPYKSFKQSLQSLDYRRLGKQRVEAFQILNVLLGRTETKGWSLNHFIITDCSNPFWHCVHTTSHRFSFGFK